MKSQRRGAFNQELSYMRSHGTVNPAAAAATGDAMAAFLAKGGKVTRLTPVKVDADPRFRAGFKKKRGKK